MNLFGISSGSKSPLSHTSEASTSSSAPAASPAGRAGQLQRQQALPLNSRYHATVQPASPERARARLTLGAASAEPAVGGLTRQSAQRENPQLASFHQQMQNSPKMSRADPLPPAPERLPARLQQKIDALSLPTLKKLDKALYEYGRMATDLAKEGSGSNALLTRLDKKLMPLLAATENARNPGLNLQVFTNGEACYQAIRVRHQQVKASGQPVTMRAIYPPFKGAPDHHIALDIQLRPGHRPSVIGFESALGHMMGSMKDAISQGLGGAKVQMVGNLIQSSQWDCAMYSLSHALKSFKHYDDYSARLHAGERGVPLPPEFLKHSQSKSHVEGRPQQDSIVTKDKGGLHAETLLHRNLAYRAQRFERAYSTSIEGFRMQAIRRAGEFLAEQRRG